MDILKLFGYKDVDEITKLGLEEAIKRKKRLIKKEHPDNGGTGEHIKDIKDGFEKIVSIIAEHKDNTKHILDIDELLYLYKDGIDRNELFNDNYFVRVGAEVYINGERYGEVERIFKIAYDRRYRLEYNVSAEIGCDIGIIIGKSETLIRNSKYKNVVNVEVEGITVYVVIFVEWGKLTWILKLMD